MYLSNVHTLKDLVCYLNAQIARESSGDSPTTIAWSITNLGSLRDFDIWRKHYPLLEKLVDLASDLEVTEQVGYAPASELWDEIKKLTKELDESLK